MMYLHALESEVGGGQRSSPSISFNHYQVRPVLRMLIRGLLRLGLVAGLM